MSEALVWPDHSHTSPNLLNNIFYFLIYKINIVIVQKLIMINVFTWETSLNAVEVVVTNLHNNTTNLTDFKLVTLSHKTGQHC